MERVLRWPCASSAYVCIALCVCVIAFDGVVNFAHFAVQMRFNGNDDSACVDLRLFAVWIDFWVGPKLTERTFVLLRFALIWRCH